MSGVLLGPDGQPAAGQPAGTPDLLSVALVGDAEVAAHAVIAGALTNRPIEYLQDQCAVFARAMQPHQLAVALIQAAAGWARTFGWPDAPERIPLADDMPDHFKVTARAFNHALAGEHVAARTALRPIADPSFAVAVIDATIALLRGMGGNAEPEPQSEGGGDGEG